MRGRSEPRPRRRSASPPHRGSGSTARRRWGGLPLPELIASAAEVLASQVELPYLPEEYCDEVAALCEHFPELVWQRDGKPDKISLGSRARSEDWGKFRCVCPKIVETAEMLLRSLDGQAAEVSFGDVLDYRGGHLLGWHQDNMDVTRHTFTAVLTLFDDGEGRFEWRDIAPDGRSLGHIVASTQPRPGSLAIHGLTCNNALAHRAYWDHGRRITLVLFCRSDALASLLAEKGLRSDITMKHWWTKELEVCR